MGLAPYVADDWLEWAQTEIFFSKKGVPSREDKEAKTESESTRTERMMNNLDVYDTDSEADETFRRDFYEQAVDELKRRLRINKVPGGDDVDLRDLDNFVKHVRNVPTRRTRWGSDEDETLEAHKNNYVGAVHEPLAVGGKAEGLNVVTTGHENLDLDLEEIGSGVLYAISRDDLEADLPKLEGYSDVYLVSTHGEVKANADRVRSGAHIYAESRYDACVEVDGVGEDGVIEVMSTHGDTYLGGADVQEDNVSAVSPHGSLHNLDE